ncbi:hypothetical protein BGS_0407 [Beggiatoa sp. SS]|nr:hypothetical protein BGS_0407 [Beggiatoa sp. SS]
MRFLISNSQQLKQLSKSSSHLKVTNNKSANYNGGQYNVFPRANIEKEKTFQTGLQTGGLNLSPNAQFFSL